MIASWFQKNHYQVKRQSGIYRSAFVERVEQGVGLELLFLKANAIFAIKGLPGIGSCVGVGFGADDFRKVELARIFLRLTVR